MTDQPAPRRDPWHLVWRLATADGPLAVILLGLALFFFVLALLPRPAADPFGADRWLTQVQTRFGPVGELFGQMGLYTLADSLLPRLLLAAAGFLLVVRTLELGERLWHSRRLGRSARADLLRVTAYVGPLLLLLGHLVGHLWGWRLEGLIGHSGGTLSLDSHGDIVLENTASGVRSGRSGVSVYVTDTGPQLTVRAHDLDGRRLGLQRTSREPTTQELTVPLLPEAPESYFAVPEAKLVFRVGIRRGADLSADAPLFLQVFRSPGGELIQEAELAGPELEFTAGEIRMRIVRSPYLVLAVAHDPERWLKGAGLIIGAAGLLGTLAWSRRRHGWAGTAVRGGLALLTLNSAGFALRSLVIAGSLWDHSPVQAGITAVWLAGLAVWLLWEGSGIGTTSEAGGSP